MYVVAADQSRDEMSDTVWATWFDFIIFFSLLWSQFYVKLQSKVMSTCHPLLYLCWEPASDISLSLASVLYLELPWPGWLRTFISLLEPIYLHQCVCNNSCDIYSSISSKQVCLQTWSKYFVWTNHSMNAFKIHSITAPLTQQKSTLMVRSWPRLFPSLSTSQRYIFSKTYWYYIKAWRN